MKCALNDLNRSSISNTVANDQKATKGDPDKERVKRANCFTIGFNILSPIPPSKFVKDPNNLM